MSKNHPNDNIYSILGKLDALKPIPAEERFALVKEICESVEAKGSILEGVDKIESRLKEKFNESSAVCSECGMTEGECEHTMNEREFHTKDEFDDRAEPGDKYKSDKHTATKTDRGTRYTAHPQNGDDDDEDSLDKLHSPYDGPKKGRPRKEFTKNPRRSPDAPKGARGRPKKAEKSDSGHKLHDLFNRVKASAHKTAEKPWNTEKTHRHVDEGVTKLVTESVNFKRMMEEQHMTLDEMLECMNADMQQFKESGICSDRLRDMMEVYAHAKKQMEETIDPANPRDYEIPAVQRRAQGQAPLTMQDVQDKDQKAAMDYQRRVGNVQPDPLQKELNELAKLAGLSNEGNAFTGKLKDTAKGDSFELDGKEYTDTSTLDEEPEMEGNAFGKAVRDAKADGVQPGEKVKVGGKEYPVKESDPRKWSMDPKPEDMPKGERQRPAYFEEKLEVDEKGANPANAPKPKYGTIKQITTQGDDLNRQKKQFKKEYPGDNPTTNVSTLESRLAAEYESIKKISK